MFSIVWDSSLRNPAAAALIRPADGTRALYRAAAVVRLPDGRELRACLQRDRADKARGERAADSVVFYRNGRRCPDNHYSAAREFALAAFRDLYRAALAVDFDESAPGWPAVDYPRPAGAPEAEEGLAVRVTVEDMPDGMIAVSADDADGQPVDAGLFAEYANAERAARQMAARFGVDVFDSTKAGRAALEAAAPAKAETIRLEMNWKAAAGIIGAALENGTGEGRRAARVELARMAELADERNTLARELERRESAELKRAESGIIAEYPLRGDGCQAPGAIVLRHLPDNDVTPFAVHFRNDQDSERMGRPVYYFGDYAATLADGWSAFGDKVKRYDPAGRLGALEAL